MGYNSGIEWTTHTFNPWIGCQKVSEGCRYCYAERDFARKPRWENCWGPPSLSTRLRTSDAYWAKPLKWNDQARAAGERPRVLCGSLCDVFEDNSSVGAWRFGLFHLIEETPYLTWMLLTKRIHLVHEMIPVSWSENGWPENVWIGTSVENDETYQSRIDHIVRLVGANKRFLSIEPILGPVSLSSDVRISGESYFPLLIDHVRHTIPRKHIDWVIAGCESGPKRRPDDLDWYRKIRDDCVAADVKFFLKQANIDGKLVKMPKLDGKVWDEVPE